ncbi:hypothetical protein PORCAN_136 [Porphyromonas crevioricanis JCM 13913]|nr:hypothetical protein PORCAN_136 [Porphyromonas crevioricanis JCM 13913]
MPDMLIKAGWSIQSLCSYQAISERSLSTSSFGSKARLFDAILSVRNWDGIIFD